MSSQVPSSSAGLKSAWLVFFLLTPIYLLSVFQRIAPSILAPDLAQSLQVPISDLAIMSSAMFIAYGIMQLPSGLLTDAMGGRRTLTLLSLMAGSGTLLFAASSTLSGATAARLLTGLGAATVVPCLGMAARYFPAQIYGKVSGLFMAFGIMGTVLAGAPLGYVAGIWGWRTVMTATGLVTVALALVIWFFVQDPPAEADTKDSPGIRDRLIAMGQGLRTVLGTPSFWPLCLWFACQAGLFFGFGGLWWGPYLMQGCGLSQAEAGSIISLAFLVTIPGQPLMAMLSDKLQSRKKIFILCTGTALACMVTYFFFGPRLPYAVLLIHGILFALSGSTFASVSFASTRESFPLRIVGTATGWLQTLPYLLMVPVVQKVFGMIYNWSLAAHGGHNPTAYAWALWANIGLLLLACLLLFFVKETYPSRS